MRYFKLSNSAKTTWKIYRITNIVLIPFVCYLLVKIISISKLPYEQIISELSSTWAILYILIFTVLGLFHMRLGVYEIMQDYVHNETLKKFLKILISVFILGIVTLVCLSLLLILMS
jgi:succinate dehydrogenase / fumarate reductase membrane anchor subunit